MNLEKIIFVEQPAGTDNVDDITYALAGYTGLEEDLEIPSSYNGYQVIRIMAGALSSNSKMKSLIIPKSIKYIENGSLPTRSDIIYYTEWTSEAEFTSNINDGSSNVPSNQRKYYSETEPTNPDTYDQYWCRSEGQGFKISTYDDYMIDSKYFKVTQDGSATASDITLTGSGNSLKNLIDSDNFKVTQSGNIQAASGAIANLDITSSGLQAKNTVTSDVSFALYNKGMSFFDSEPSINFQNYFSLRIDSENQGLIEASNQLKIAGNNSFLLFNSKPDENNEKTISFSLEFLYEKNGGDRYLSIYLQKKQDSSTPIFTENFQVTTYAISGNIILREWGSFNWEIGKDYSQNYRCCKLTNGYPLRDFEVEVVIWSQNFSSKSYKFETKSVDTGVRWKVGDESFTQTLNTNDIYIEGNFIPNTKNTSTLGSSNNLWGEIFCKQPAINPSDRNEKNTINILSDKYEKVFDNLKPVSYKFNENTSDRTHVGFIAQDVEEAILDAGLTTQEFAGICYWDKEGGTKGYGLRYGEFIALCVDQTQKLKSRVKELEAIVEELRSKIN